MIGKHAAEQAAAKRIGALVRHLQPANDNGTTLLWQRAPQNGQQKLLSTRSDR